MYLGIDFLIDPKLKPYLIEVNIGLPGGAQEYDYTHQVIFGRSSNIFKKIEEISYRVYRKRFKDYINNLPFIESLKQFKIWMDGEGDLPQKFHPVLRLEDKWIQYSLLHKIASMPETVIFDPLIAKSFFKKKGKLVLKRRLGRGGRGFKIISDLEYFSKLNIKNDLYLLQEYIESKIRKYTLSIRVVSFSGEFVCMYANLSHRDYSNHGIITYVTKGENFDFPDSKFETVFFNQKSWEAEIWFGENYPSYLKHNLFEDEVLMNTLLLPERVFSEIKEISIKVERNYENLDLFSLPQACFEKEKPFLIKR